MTNDDLGWRTAEATEEAARLELYKQREQGYTASFIDTVTSGGGTINMRIANPSDSGVAIDIVTGLISSQFGGEFRAYDSFSSAPTGGTAVPVDNLLMDSGDTNGETSITVTRGTTFTADNTHFETLIGSSGPFGGGTPITLTEPIIEPGREVVIELTNTSPDNNPGGLGVVYLEREDF